MHVVVLFRLDAGDEVRGAPLASGSHNWQQGAKRKTRLIDANKVSGRSLATPWLVMYHKACTKYRRSYFGLDSVRIVLVDNNMSVCSNSSLN